MATAKQRAWRAKFARLYGRKKKKRSSPKRARRTASTKKVKTVARRFRRSRPRRSYSRKKTISISVMAIGHAAMQYSNLTGQPLGSVIQALTNSLINGDDSVLDVILGQVNLAVTNITENAAGVAIRAALIAGVWALGRQVVGHKTIFKVGKFRITV